MEQQMHSRASSLPNLSSTTPGSDSTTNTKSVLQIPGPVRQALSEKGLNSDQYGVVYWKEYTTFHPRQWSLARKAYNSAVICSMEFIMTLVSNAGSSIVPRAIPELGISREAGLFYFTTLYLLGQAVGGLLLPPMAESYASSRIYTTSSVGFAVACVIIGSCPHVPVIAVFRFISGFLSAMPCVVAAGSIENLWDTKARIWLIHIWICCSVLGLAFAPLVTTAITESSLGWHWLFYIASIVTFALSFFCAPMRESRPAQFLRHQVKDVAHEHKFRHFTVPDDDAEPSLVAFVSTSLTLPIKMFFAEPIVFLTSIMGATVYGVIYLFSAALPVVYRQYFDFSPLQGSFVFIAIAVGVLLSFLPRVYDARLLGARDNTTIQPEEKLFGFFIAAPVLAIGLWWFGFAVPPLSHTSPWASIPSLALFGFSVVEFDNVLSGYLCDTYTSRTASAIAPMSFLRAILSGTFPLFGSQMFSELNPNNALFVLAGIATAFCAVAALFGVYGRSIRQHSPLAERTASIRPADKLKTVAVVCGMGAPDMSKRGMNWFHYAGFTVGWLYFPAICTWWMSREPHARFDLPREERGALLAKALLAAGNHPKDLEGFNSDFGTDIVRLLVSNHEASFGGHGTAAVVQDGQVICSAWGFKLGNIRNDLPVQLWYGKLDISCPPVHGEESKARIGANAVLYLEEETHGSITFNRTWGGPNGDRARVLQELCTSVAWKGRYFY